MQSKVRREGQEGSVTSEKENFSLLLSLPVLVQDLLIEFLDLESKKNLRLTCSYFFSLTNRKLSFVPLVSDQTADAFVQRSFACRVAIVSDLALPHTISPMKGMEFSGIQTLVFVSWGKDLISSHNFFRVLRHCNTITRLEIVGTVLTSFQIVDKEFYRRIRLDKLRSLMLGFQGREHRLLGVDALGYARFPQLEQLAILVVPEEQPKLSQAEFKGIFQLIDSHKTLKTTQIYDAHRDYVLTAPFQQVQQALADFRAIQNGTQ